MGIRKLVVLAYLILFMMEIIFCLSSNIAKKMPTNSRNNTSRASNLHSQFVDGIFDDIEGKRAEDILLRSESNAIAFLRNPCILEKLALYFEVNSLRLILSKQYLGLKDTLEECRNAFSRSIRRKSVVYIDGDENSHDDLKKNALHFLTRDIECFVVVCSDICSSLFLSLAVNLGFGVDIYFWITIKKPVHASGMIYPNILTHISEKRVSNQSSHFILTTLSMSGSSGEQFNQYDHGRSGVAPKKNQPLMEIISPFEGEGYAILYPRLSVKKTSLQIVTLMSSSNYQQSDLLDHKKKKCKRGLLCWYYPKLRNGSFADNQEPSCCLGLLMDILAQLKEDLHMDFYIYEVEDHLWGAGVNGSWHGLIGEVLHRKADIAAQWLIVNQARLEIVDFTEPLYTTAAVLVAPSQLSPLPFLNLEAFAAISTQSWILILCLTLLSGGIIYLTERLISLHPNVDNKMLKIQVLTYAIGLLFQRDVAGHVPRNLGSRVVSVALAITLMIIMTTYTAVLTTKNIINIRTLPISGLDDPKLTDPATKLKVGTYKYSPHMRLFEASQKATWKRVAKIMRLNSFTTFAEAVKRMRKGTLHAAIVSEDILKKGWKNSLHCDLRIAQNILKQPLALALPKKSPWREPISNLLRRYRENGFLDQMKSKYKASKCPEEKGHQPQQFSLLYLSCACIMLVLGVLLSIFLFNVEHLFNVYTKKRKAERISAHTLSNNNDK